ncbi:hypothetical protein BESB_015150 [Besnoitia besnoiti]|uniref:Transmembrane protein n=1 Tax=Besnoitia besnoiti TaxID=94643 RepID=A0A2A9MBY5_BESBE|nr:hypothetical protein BESB_015150 [Besnoitia besnoiti]PFH32902.1 hypothetical protein BESB_015150 [Besnoitia besnoiti]
MAKDKRPSAKKAISSSSSPASPPFSSLAVPSPLLGGAASPDAHPFGLAVTADPQRLSAAEKAPSLPVLLLPPASQLSSDGKTAAGASDFFAFHRGLPSAGTPTDLLCRRLPRQAALALQQLPGGCAIRGLWLRVPAEKIDEKQANFTHLFAVSSLLAAFAGLPGPCGAAPSFLAVLLVSAGAPQEAESRRKDASAVRCLVLRTDYSSVSAPLSVPVNLVASLSLPPSAGWTLCAYASVLPLRVDVSFSPREVLSAVSLQPEETTNLLAHELTLALLDEYFAGPLLFVQEGEREPVCAVLPDRHAFALPSFAPRRPLVYLQPLQTRQAPLRFSLSPKSCERGPSLALESAPTTAPEGAESGRRVVSAEGAFVATAVGSSLPAFFSSLAASSAADSSPLSNVCSALCGDLAASLSRRVVQALLDYAAAAEEAEGGQASGKNTGDAAAFPLSLGTRQFFWPAAASRGGGKGGEGAGDQHAVAPLLIADTKSPFAEDEGDGEEDPLAAAREALGFLLGVSNPLLESELVEGVFPPSLRAVLSSAPSSDAAGGAADGATENGAGAVAVEGLVGRGDFWSALEAKVGGNGQKGAGRTQSGGSVSANVGALLIAAVAALLAIVFAFLPNMGSKARA